MKRSFVPSLDFLEDKTLMSMTLTGGISPAYAAVEYQQVVDRAPNINPDATYVAAAYQNILGRTPDFAGFTGWLNAYYTCSHPSQITNAFWNSPEHKANPIGNPSFGDLASATHAIDDACVNSMYRTVLHRDGDAEGIAYWDKVLDNDSMTPLQVNGDFSSSQEHNTIERNRASGLFVESLYGNILHRFASQTEVNYWVDTVNSGASANQMEHVFYDSPEHDAWMAGNPHRDLVVGTLPNDTFDAVSSATNDTFVKSLYYEMLNRPGDAAGIAYWDSVLSSNSMTPSDVITSFRLSPEYAALNGHNVV